MPAQINLLFQNSKGNLTIIEWFLLHYFLIQKYNYVFSLYILGKIGEHTVKKESVLSLLNSNANLEALLGQVEVIYNPGFFLI